ncbi:methylated-DNA--[protein]-cysteine S-methyltransferase [Streptomyces spirodelae]|uniref:Methylated-DNA--protein-cysteine methyltransferase n=1 Tax=Streptomyces spirodelae TaxID=2812904 RepID=A0ABS3WY93_9ACTN|nr:methylated-DNA--[protein]-cysteine S-methyltransferase [Streptomyces spirodelae]MBO8188028.1 methylated-DNA--[protein]-cysteine S-methyltransferase [Streptomyces spirodelae]
MTDTPARPPAWTPRETPIGPLLLAATEKGLVNVVFHAEGRTIDRALARLSARLGAEPEPAESLPAQPPPDEHGPTPAGHLATAVAALDRYFAGSPGPVTVPLDWSLSGGFNERVLRALAAHVPYGATVGYEDLARRVGEPGAARAVGVAMGSNPLPVVVPCHRVLESSGGIGGFGGGLETKRALLALEGVLPQPLF